LKIAHLHLACIVWLLLSGLAGLQADAQTLRVGVVIGNNDGRPESPVLRYAEDDARKVHQLLIERGGFRKDKLQLLLGENAEALERELEALDGYLRRHAGPGESALVVIFYSGHADGQALEMGSTRFAYDKIRRFLRESPARVRLAIIDSCHSGGLLKLKASKTVEGFPIQLTDQLASAGYAIVTSSAHNEVSQESEEIRGSFFTHYLISGLRGAADLSGDGQVTLNELYQHVYSNTVSRTSRTIGGKQHPMYDFHLSGRGDLVLASGDFSTTALAIAPPGDGRLVVVSEDSESLAAEVQLEKMQVVRLGLAPGDYRVYHINPDGIRLARVKLEKSEKQVKPSDFQEVQLQRTVAKGGLFSARARHRLGTGVVVRRFPLEQGLFSYGLALQYHMDERFFISPTIRLVMTTAPDIESSRGYYDISVAAGAAKSWSLGWSRLELELLAGVEQLFQDPLQNQERYSFGFSYMGLTRWVLPLGLVQGLVSAGVGGRIFKLRSEGWVQRLDFQISLGLTWFIADN
jgi:caspase domain-containing protein